MGCCSSSYWWTTNDAGRICFHAYEFNNASVVQYPALQGGEKGEEMRGDDKQKWKMFHFIILKICFNLVTNYLFSIRLDLDQAPRATVVAPAGRYIP